MDVKIRASSAAEMLSLLAEETIRIEEDIARATRRTTQVRVALEALHQLTNTLSQAATVAASRYRMVISVRQEELRAYSQAKKSLEPLARRRTPAATLLANPQSALDDRIQACTAQLRAFGQELVHVESLVSRLDGLRISEAVRALWEAEIHRRSVD